DGGLESLRDVDPGRSAGATVQVLVRTADREVDPVLVQADRVHPRGVAQVPDDQRAGGVHRGRDLRQVVQLAGAEVDVAVHRDRHVRVQARRVIRPGGPYPKAEQRGHRIDDVPIGGK